MKKISRILAIILLFILSTGAFYGGWELITDPSGKSMQFPIELLEGTPFSII